MGYYTRFSVKLKGDPTPMVERPVVQDIVAFMQRAGFEFREETGARLVTELSKHFVGFETDVSVIQKRLEEISDYSFTEDGDHEFTSDDIKWYDHEAHMTKLSSEFPTYTFEVDGEGEEQGDVWKQTFKAGVASKKKRARIVFDYED